MASACRRQPREQSAAGDRPRVLVAAPGPESLQSLCRPLTGEFVLHPVGGVAEAMRVLEEGRAGVVLVEQRMPEMTGVELLRQVRHRWPDIVGVLCVPYGDLKAAIDASDEGTIFRYITKPCAPEELQMVVRQACAQFDQVTQRKRLLAELWEYQADCLSMMEELREGRLGALNLRGQAKAEQLAEAGTLLLERLA